MQSVHQRTVFLRAGHGVERIGGEVDHRRAENAEVANEVPAAAELGERKGLSVFESRQIELPQWRTADVGVERVQRIAHGCDIEDVVRAAVDRDVRYIQRL